jgi:hypothetical protein
MHEQYIPDMTCIGGSQDERVRIEKLYRNTVSVIQDLHFTEAVRHEREISYAGR